MSPRTDPLRTAQPDHSPGAAEPSRPEIHDFEEDRGPGLAADRTDVSVTYADHDAVMESARLMLQIHRDTFRKLAE